MPSTLAMLTVTMEGLVRESGHESSRGTARSKRARVFRIAAILAILASVSCLLGGCFRPEPTPENVLPEAHFTCTPASGNSPLFVSFDASGSEDADGDIESYEWAFGDGGSASGVLASHTYSATATRTFVATLTVTDDRGGQTTADRSIAVIVSAPPTLPPLTPPTPSHQYVASRNSDVFHLPSCSSAAQINSENRIYFDTREEAVGSGRRPCSRCNP